MSYTTNTSASFALTVGQSVAVRTQLNEGAKVRVQGASADREYMVNDANSKTIGPFAEAKTVTVSALYGTVEYDYGTAPSLPAFVYTSAQTESSAPSNLALGYQPATTPALDATSQQVLANSGVRALAQFTSGTRTGRAVNEKVSVAAAGTLTLLDTTSTPGPGVVDSVEIIASVGSGVQGAILSAYVDGESAPSVTFELNNLGNFLITVPATSTGNFYATAHVEAGVTGVANGQGYWTALRYPIPYSKSVRIVISAVPATTVYFTQVDYTIGAVLPWRLKTNSIGYANRLTGQDTTTLGNRSLKMLDLPSGAGNTGFIAGLTYVGAYANNLSYLEKNIVVYQGTQPRDGSVAPLWNSSGTEDIFGDPYYFGLGAAGLSSKPGRFVSSFNKSGTYFNVTAHVDFLQLYGGIKYDDGCLLTTETGLAADPGVTTGNAEIFYCTFYYVPA
jgi:hypothetical protein